MDPKPHGVELLKVAVCCYHLPHHLGSLGCKKAGLATMLVLHQADGDMKIRVLEPRSYRGPT